VTNSQKLGRGEGVKIGYVNVIISDRNVEVLRGLHWDWTCKSGWDLLTDKLPDSRDSNSVPSKTEYIDCPEWFSECVRAEVFFCVLISAAWLMRKKKVFVGSLCKTVQHETHDSSSDNKTQTSINCRIALNRPSLVYSVFRHTFRPLCVHHQESHSYTIQ
jgi:hypothetical protein